MAQLVLGLGMRCNTNVIKDILHVNSSQSKHSTFEPHINLKYMKSHFIQYINKKAFCESLSIITCIYMVVL